MSDLIIKYKGQPIVEMTESGTKTLKTAGKYCEGDISVEYAKPAGGGGGGFAETIVTDVIENHIVSSSWSPSVTSKEYIPDPSQTAKNYYYNGILLPKIPTDVLANYPMCLIYLPSGGTKYRLLAGTKTWYVYGSAIRHDPSTYVVYNAKSNSDSWAYETQSADNGNYGIGDGIKWSNHDIPNGSATATDIYFNGSEPIPAE